MKFKTIQSRHSEKHLARVINLRIFTLDNGFTGKPVANEDAANILRHQISSMDARLQISEDGKQGRCRLHSNHWYEFEVKAAS